MERIKKNSAKRVLPHLSDDLRSKLSIQRGLNKRQMWKRSFRGIPTLSEKMFRQKVNYIHMNPVRAGLCERPLDYRRSSRWMYEEGLWQFDLGLTITDDVSRDYCDPSLLSLSRRGKLEEAVD